MKYLKKENNRYKINFMVATEKLINDLSTKQFIEYLKKNATYEDEGIFRCDKTVVHLKEYSLWETPNLCKSFAITDDEKIYYWRTLSDFIELVD